MADREDDLRARIKELESLLRVSDQDVKLAATTFGLPAGMARLFGLLRSLPVVTAEIAEQRAGMATDIKVAIHRLRKYLLPHDIVVQSQYLVGYWLTPETKARIDKMIRDANAQPAVEE